MRKPVVLTRCVANHHAGPDERIVEFNDRSLSDGGGLISFRRFQGKLLVSVYCCGKDVKVSELGSRSS